MTGSQRAPSPVILRVCFENREADLGALKRLLSRNAAAKRMMLLRSVALEA